VFSERINKWFSIFKKYLFIKKDGFFELPYLSNSPEAIVNSLAKMPFVKHFPEKQIVRSNNPFTRSTMHYQKIEKGLWMIHGDTEYKANINFRSTVDKSLPSDYYVLNFKIAHWKTNSKMSLINGIPYRKFSWLLYKPNANTSNYHFKGSRELWFAVFFNDQWLKEVLCEEAFFKTSNLKYFFESETRFVVWPEETEYAANIYMKSLDLFQLKENTGKINLDLLRDSAINQLMQFANKYKTDSIRKNFFEIPDADHKKMLKVEKILQQNIHLSFIGIDELARQAGISPTKLKANFKIMNGQTVFQYFREKQMEYARTLLENNKNQVKVVALLFGYTSASKFSAAFKKQFGFLPSQLLNSREDN